MTENQKAATFIGWGHCAAGSWDWDKARLTFTCLLCGRVDPDGKHAPEPDMSKPENYMRAVESVVQANRFWSVILDVSTHECIFEEDAMPIKRPVKDIRCEGHDMGDAVVKALAALYDAEPTAQTLHR